MRKECEKAYPGVRALREDDNKIFSSTSGQHEGTRELMKNMKKASKNGQKTKIEIKKKMNKSDESQR